MSEFSLERFHQLRIDFVATANYIKKQGENLRKREQSFDRYSCDLILTYNNLVIYITNNYSESDGGTRTTLFYTLIESRKSLEHCIEILNLNVKIPKNLYDRIESDILDKSFDNVPDNFAKSHFHNKSKTLDTYLEKTPDTPKMLPKPFNLMSYSTPIRNQVQNIDNQKPLNTGTIPKSNPINNQSGATVVSQINTSIIHDQPIDVVTKSQPSSNSNMMNDKLPMETKGIQNNQGTNGSDMSPMAPESTMPMITTLDNATGQQYQAHRGNIAPSINPTYTLAQMNLNQSVPQTQMNTHMTHMPQQYIPQSFNNYNNNYQTQQNTVRQPDYNAVIARANQIIEQQSQQLQQNIMMSETLMAEIRMQRECYQQLINNHLSTITNNTQQTQSTNNNNNKVRQEYREIIKNIPDFDGEKNHDLNNLLHVAELAYENSNSIDEMNAFYLSLKLHLKPRVSLCLQ